MKKLLILAVLLSGCVGAVRGEDVKPGGTSLLDFTFLNSVRGGYAFNQHLEKSVVIYGTFKDFHSANGISYVTLNLGYDGAKKRPMIALLPRADNIDALICSGKWGKSHISTAKVPSFEFGPYFSAELVKTKNGYKIDSYYGLVAGIGINVTTLSGGK